MNDMKKKNFLFLFFILSIFPGLSQSFQDPIWKTENVCFHASKISQWNPKEKGSRERAVFKSSSIVFEGANTKTPKVTVDIKNLFYIKQAEVYSMDFKRIGPTKRVEYILKKGDDMFLLILAFENNEENVPSRAVFSFPHVSGKLGRIYMTYQLTEIK